MAFVEKTGKSVDEAVAAALAELNVTADQAVVEVLEEAKKGFLGFGRKDARVRVSVKPAEAEAEKPAEAAPAAEKTVSEAAADAVAAVKVAATVAAGALAKKADAVKADAAVAAEDFKKKAAAWALVAAWTAVLFLAVPFARAAQGAIERFAGPRIYFAAMIVWGFGCLIAMLAGLASAC